MARQAPGVVHVAHREYLGDINPTSNFNVTTFPLNPGMGQTFPWLSQMASSYEEYYFKSLTFHFRSMSSSSILAVGGANTSLGTVILSTEYNAILPKFTTKNQMENHQFAASIKPSQNVSHRIQTRASHTPLNKLFIRNSTPEANTDKRLYDIGNFQIATQGMQAITDDTKNWSIGELWVSYDVCFLKPKISDIPLSGCDVYELASTVSGPIDQYVTSENPFTTSSGGVGAVGGSVGILRNSVLDNNTPTFAAHLDGGYYKFDYFLTGTSAATTFATGTPTLNTFKRCRLIAIDPIEGGVPPYSVAPEDAAATSNHMCSWIIQITGPAVNENDPASFHFKYLDNWACDASRFMLYVSILPPQLCKDFIVV